MALDPERIHAKLHDIANALARLQLLQKMNKDAFLSDEDSQDIARSRLLTAMEAALNVCYHLTAQVLKRVPEDYAACFRRLIISRISKSFRLRSPGGSNAAESAERGLSTPLRDSGPGRLRGFPR